MNKYSAVQWSPGGTTVNKGPICTDRGPKCAGKLTVPPPQYFHFNHWLYAAWSWPQRVNGATENASLENAAPKSKLTHPTVELSKF